MALSTLAAVIVVILVGMVTYFRHKYKYWAKKGVPYIEPQMPFGHLQNPLFHKQAIFQVINTHYNHFKAEGHRHAGLYFFHRPVYIPIDPELIKNILVKDFVYFQDRGVYYDEKHDPLSAHLFSIEGEKWRNLRLKLTPTFTSGKMKMMFQTLLDCGDQMMEKISELSERKEAIDSKELLACFTTDVIGSCAFGLECNSFKDKDSEFRPHGRKMFLPKWSTRYRRLLITLAPNLCRKIGVPAFERSLTNFYFDAVKSMVKYREGNSIYRNDFMQILLELKNGRTDGKMTETEGLTIEEIAAQAFVFFLAGFETSSTLMNFCLFELAQNENIQERVRKDVLDTLKGYDGKITYDSIMDMKYLGQVIDETVRKHPPGGSIVRKCTTDYKIPNTDIVLERGTQVFISIYGLHHDPEYYPDPEKFDPDRFSDENKASRHQFVYLPFGEGPRMCIGLRFGLMQSRVGLSLILKNYRVTLNPKTILPLGQNPTTFILQPLHDIYLDMERINT